MLLLGSIADVYGNTLLTEDFESPIVTGYAEGTTPPGWVRSSQGYGASRHGLNEYTSGNWVTNATSGKQVYSFRYTNSGMTSDKETVNVLYTGLTFTVSFDVTADFTSGKTGTYYSVKFVAFDYGAARDDTRNDGGSVVLATKTGNAPNDGTFANVVFQYTVTGSDISNLGKDLAIRFIGSSTCANIDNVQITDDATGDQIPPLIQWKYPADNATTVADGAKLVLIYHEDLVAGTGNITLKETSDDSTVEVIPVGSVDISGRTATITPSAALERGTEYYVLMDAGVFQDAVANESLAITSSTAWNFTTCLDDAPEVLWQDSFEAPTVSGSKKTTAPDNWLRGTVNTSSGLANTNTGTFSTAYGAQAASIWNSSASLTLDEGILKTKVESLVAEQEYRVTFNVADGTDLDGSYKVSMMAFTNGAVRNDGADGVVLKSVNGTASLQDMGQQADGFAYTASDTNAYLGQLVAVRIEGSGALVDNLTFSWDPPPAKGTVLMIK